ncbi:MAG: HAMP domain-containing sensor histidine kinase [Gemmatimonadaceae bacterium]|nr:HAMP domain-containing sensor histidine kinase [Gemmatimonadaceae bacterium]
MTATPRESEDPRVAEILDVILQFAAGNLKARGVVSDQQSALDAVMAGINILGEELEAYVGELKRTQAALRQANATLVLQNRLLEETDRTRTEFMANVSHELRTPLGHVISFAELLKEKATGPLYEEQAEFVGDIMTSGLRLLSLVDGILEMSRANAAGAALEREPVEIGTVLEDRVAAHREAAEAQRVTIGLKVTPDTGDAQLDPLALRRMLDALLDNAIKFNRAGGSVAVSARRDAGWVEIAVADTGVGIAHEELATIFNPLVQLDAGLTRRHGGVGLGLALARRLAALHDGTIEVRSEPGEGTTFTLRLPVGGKS